VKKDLESSDFTSIQQRLFDRIEQQRELKVAMGLVDLPE